MLACDPECTTGGREDAAFGTSLEDGHSGIGYVIGEVLAVVEHEEEATVAEEAEEVDALRPIDLGSSDVELADDRFEDVVAGLQACQVDDPGSVAESIRHLPGALDREPGLAGATRTDDRHEALRCEGMEHPGGVVVPADEARQGKREVRGEDGGSAE